MTPGAELNLCGDETMYSHIGFREPGSGLVAQIMGKPGISKGSQIVLVTDLSQNCPQMYTHWHKCHKKDDGWNKQGPSEVQRLMEIITPGSEES